MDKTVKTNKRGERCWKGWKHGSCLQYVFPKCYPPEDDPNVLKDPRQRRAAFVCHGPCPTGRQVAPPLPYDGRPANLPSGVTTYSDIYYRTGGDYNPKTAPKFEIRSDRVMRRCDCLRRNGLQSDCYRMKCSGRPECMHFPLPKCEPSKGGRNIWELSD